jgi:hypothetical protein
MLCDSFSSAEASLMRSSRLGVLLSIGRTLFTVRFISLPEGVAGLLKAPSSKFHEEGRLPVVAGTRVDKTVYGRQMLIVTMRRSEIAIVASAAISRDNVRDFVCVLKTTKNGIEADLENEAGFGRVICNR